MAVVGKSGSGKSVFMQEMLLSLLGTGGKVWVIDVGRWFEKTCKLLGGNFIEFTQEKSLCINPFTFIGDLDPFSLLLYSSKAEHFALMKKLQAQGLSLIEAIEVVAGEKC